MKHGFAVILAALFCLMLLQPSLSEGVNADIEVDGYRLTCEIPDGYTIETKRLNNLTLMVDLIPKESHWPDLNMTVTRSEELDGTTLNDSLPEEEFQRIEAALIQDAVAPEVTVGETTYGTKLLMMREETEADDYLVMISVWNGYVIETHLFPGAGEKRLSDEDIDMAVRFNSNFFIHAKAGESPAKQ